jgi:hypothetical protein
MLVSWTTAGLSSPRRLHFGLRGFLGVMVLVVLSRVPGPGP